MKKKSTNIDERLNLLSEIERAQVSPFLKTRIDQLVESDSFLTIKPKWAFSIMVSFVLILAINIFVMQNMEVQQDQNSNTSYNSFTSNNTLY